MRTPRWFLILLCCLGLSGLAQSQGVPPNHPALTMAPGTWYKVPGTALLSTGACFQWPTDQTLPGACSSLNTDPAFEWLPLANKYLPRMDVPQGTGTPVACFQWPAKTREGSTRCGGFTESGGTLDLDRLMLQVDSGGHGNYAGNEVYGFPLATLKWIRLTDPWPYIDRQNVTGATGFYPERDGITPADCLGGHQCQPRQGHRYNLIEWIPGQGYCLFGNAGMFPFGNLSLPKPPTVCLDVATGIWTRKTDGLTSGIGTNTVRHPGTGKILIKGEYPAPILASYDPATNTHTALSGNFNQYGYYFSTALDPDKNLLVGVEGCISYGNSAPCGGTRIGAYTVDLNPQLPTKVVPTPLAMTNAEPIRDGVRNPGLVWDSTRHQILAWNGGPTLYALNTTTRIWSPVPAAATNTVDPGPPHSTGTYGRMAYVPAPYDVIVLAIDQTKDVYLYKPMGASPPPPPPVLPSVSIGTTTPLAQEVGQVPGVLTVTRTGDTTVPLTVSYLLSGTAIPDLDYEAALTGSPGSVVMPAGASQASLMIRPLTDALVEGDETVIITLQPQATYTVIQSAATVTIVDAPVPPPPPAGLDFQIQCTCPDPAATVCTCVYQKSSPVPPPPPDLPVVTLLGPTDTTLTEGGSPPFREIQILRTGLTTPALDVSYTLSGTATPGADLLPLGGVVSLPPGAGQGLLRLSIVDDALVEDPETVTVTLASGGGYVLGHPITSTLTLLSNDVAPPPPPPGPGSVTFYQTWPSLADEQATYQRWGWTWSAGQAPNRPAEPNYRVGVNGYDPNIHDGTEGDDLWHYLVAAARTQQPGYQDRVRAWVQWYKDHYLQCDDAGTFARSVCYDCGSGPKGGGYGCDHVYGLGLILGAQQLQDPALLTVAEGIAAQVERVWSDPRYVPGYPMDYYGSRAGGRHLMFLSALADVTKAQRWITLRDKLITLWLASPDWNPTYGTYFVGAFSTDPAFCCSAAGIGIPNAYATGIRANSSWSLADLIEGFMAAYEATGNVLLRDRALLMAQHLYQYAAGINGFVASVFGVDTTTGQHVDKYAAYGMVTYTDPTYTVSVVNSQVLAYQLTGDMQYLDRAKEWLFLGTRGTFGSNTIPPRDNKVGYFVDTRFESSTVGFYLLNKGTMQYVWRLFLNAGQPPRIP